MSRKSNNPNCKKSAAIDVGTNSVKIAAGGLNEQGNFYSIVDEVVISRLGEGVDSTRYLSPIGMSRTVEAILNLLNLISGLNINHIRIVATSAVRDAQNKDEFIKLVKDKCGLELEVLSEQDECRLSFAAVARDSEINFPDDKIAVIDIGGGSTELSFGTVHTLDFCRSLEIGAVRLTEKFTAADPPDQNEMKSAEEYIDSMLAEVIGGMSLIRIAGVGGT